MRPSTNLKTNLLNETEFCMRKILTEGVQQKNSAEISIKLAQFLCLHANDIIGEGLDIQCMTFDAFINEYIRIFKEEHERAVENKQNLHKTLIIQNRQEHFFTIDMYVNDQGKIYALILDSINQAVSAREAIHVNFSSSLGPWEKKNVQTALQNALHETFQLSEHDSESSIPIEIYFLADIPSYTNVVPIVKQAQADCGSCTFFSIYYAKLLQGLKNKELDHFYKNILSNAASITQEKTMEIIEHERKNVKPENYRMIKTAEYYPKEKMIHYLSWDDLLLKFHAITQTVRGVAKLTEQHEENTTFKSTFEWFLYVNKDGKPVNTKILQYAYGILLKAKEVLVKQISVEGERIDDFFEELFQNKPGWNMLYEIKSRIYATQFGRAYFDDWLNSISKMPSIDTLKTIKSSCEIFNLTIAENLLASIGDKSVFTEGEAALIELSSPKLKSIFLTKSKKKKEENKAKELLKGYLKSGEIPYAWLVDPGFMMSIVSQGEINTEQILSAVAAKKSSTNNTEAQSTEIKQNEKDDSGVNSESLNNYSLFKMFQQQGSMKSLRPKIAHEEPKKMKRRPKDLMPFSQSHEVTGSPRSVDEISRLRHSFWLVSSELEEMQDKSHNKIVCK
ncbi:MAG: hypothetical protein VX112_02760 [Pseudomonadota bacterium]|nr:hypothetical protein [Pseudomonadota bacterium]